MALDPFSTQIASYSPIRDFRFDGATTTDLIDSGSALADLPWNNVTGNDTAGITGPTTYESDLARNPGGLGYWANPTYGTGEITGTSGTIIVALRTTSTVAFAKVVGQGNTGGAQLIAVDLQSTGEVRLAITNTFPTNAYIRRTVEQVNDGAWHLLAIRQPNDNTGIDIFIDGVEATYQADVGPSGSITNNAWWGTIAGLGNQQFVVGAASSSTHPQKFSGDLARIAYTNTVLTDQNIADLYAVFINDPSLGDFVIKTTRRRNRRVFPSYDS